MIRVFVRPALPVGHRHQAKEPVRDFQGTGMRRCQRVESGNESSSIRGKVRGASTVDARVVVGIGFPSMWPADRCPQSEPLHEGAVAQRDWSNSWTNPERHFARIAHVAEHLVRGQRTPSAGVVRTESGKSVCQTPEHRRIGNGLHSNGQVRSMCRSICSTTAALGRFGGTTGVASGTCASWQRGDQHLRATASIGAFIMPGRFSAIGSLLRQRMPTTSTRFLPLPPQQ